MKLQKRLISAVITLVMAIAISATPVMAAKGPKNDVREFDRAVATSRVYGRVTKFFTSDKNVKKASDIVEKANLAIEREIDKALASTNPNTKIVIRNLLRNTERIADNAVARCARLGVEVECVYVSVVIRGQEVMVDPLRMVA